MSVDWLERGTSNIDLYDMAKSLKIPNFLGVFMNDEIPKRFLKEMNFIVNFENSTENGKHWTAAIVHKNKKYYFDSYGCEVPDSVRNLLGKNIIRSDYQIQNYNTYSCGEFCILVIFLIVVQGMNYEDVILIMLDAVNDYNLQNNVINKIGE